MEERSVNLSRLSEYIPGLISSYGDDVLISGIELDSRKCKNGDIFVALEGLASDGHKFVNDAINRGAVAVMGMKPVDGLPVPYLQVQDSRLAMAYLSAAFFDFPAKKLVMIGITGTDGKTTTANLIYSILRAANVHVGMISTVGVRLGDEVLDSGYHVTTPESPDVQAFLSRMVDSGITHVILEATSHGLSQHRVAACYFDLGVVTNITHEHLDYHGSFESYREAKGILFSGLSAGMEKVIESPQGAVLNVDDQSYSYLANIAEVPQVTYGFTDSAQVYPTGIQKFREKVRFTAIVQSPNQMRVTASSRHLEIISHLPGDYNILNCLAAIATTSELLGIDHGSIQHGIDSLGIIPGRMEYIILGQRFDAVVDFAHTPNALHNALTAARSSLEISNKGGQLIAIFGSAGLRDRKKRRMMAVISCKLADKTILTAEDPRTESLSGILDEMSSGMLDVGCVEGENFWRIPDRREAIRFGVREAEAGDLVILCGKGHEQSMCFGDKEYPWDDRTAMRAAISEQLCREGPEMPFLPDWE